MKEKDKENPQLLTSISKSTHKLKYSNYKPKMILKSHQSKKYPLLNPYHRAITSYLLLNHQTNKLKSNKLQLLKTYR